MGEKSDLFFKKIAGYFPTLEADLESARFNVEVPAYAKKAVLSSLIFDLLLCFALLFFFITFRISITLLILLFIFLYLIFIYYFISLPRYTSLKTRKYVDAEIVSAIRFLILEIESGTPLYESLVSLSENFSLIGIYVDEIIHKIKLGSTVEEALSESVETIPSNHFKNVIWQILNSIQTGTDISESLNTLLRDIVDEQKIEYESYGRELNALSLFYMMIAIIIPTIGFTIVSAILTFIGIPIPLWALIVLWLLLTFVQYLFLMVSAARRPAVLS